MKYVLAVCCILICQATLFSQTRTLDSEQIIKRTISTGISEGFDQNILGRMGDAAAVTITKTLAGQTVNSNTIDGVLVILSASFADPELIENVSDREPKTTLFVLRYLDLSARDPRVRERIGETRTHVLQHYKKYLKK
jgi:hypothetical protein